MRKKRKKVKLKNSEQRAYQTENWNEPKYEDDPDSKPAIFRNPPTKYETNFLAKMDKRSRAYQLLHESFSEITNDLGGAESLSHVQLTLIERFCFLEFVLRMKELRMTESSNGKKDVNFGSWVQSLNALVGLAKTIGMTRVPKHVESLESYIKQRKKKG